MTIKTITLQNVTFDKTNLLLSCSKREQKNKKRRKKSKFIKTLNYKRNFNNFTRNLLLIISSNKLKQQLKYLKKKKISKKAE